MESELHNIKREMDKLKNAVKDNAVENMDRMIQKDGLTIHHKSVEPSTLTKVSYSLIRVL